MSGRFVLTLAVFASCFPLAIPQQNPILLAQPDPTPPSAQEFPVMMRQKVVAGKTPAGTRVQATLAVPTFFSGKVIPDGAIFSGVVVESEAKSAASPSRLSIRTESVEWKTGSLALTTYLTPWYHPVQLTLGEDRFDDGPGAGQHGKHTWGVYNPNASDALTSSDGSGQTHLKTAPPPAMTVLDRCLLMRDVQLERDRNGEQILVSGHSNLKLDKSTTYILTTGAATAN
ncbi:MAG TPA: hypothetical protein VL983_09485 [Terriglobales bacterium]|nr:hypothetical protein [Terriglobales bacterium]